MAEDMDSGLGSVARSASPTLASPSRGEGACEPSMVERVARAIFYAHNASGPLAIGGRPGRPLREHRVARMSDLDGWEEKRERYIEMAREAVFALREPTGDMWIAADNRGNEVPDEAGWRANRIADWEAMIDAALATQPVSDTREASNEAQPRRATDPLT